MYHVFVSLHNLLRWIVLILLIINIVRALAGMTSGKPFTGSQKKTGLFLMISAHTIFLLGLIQWLFGPWGLQLIRNYGMGPVMKNSVYRYWAVEHITGMLIAIVLITIGRGVSKKNISDKSKHNRTFWYYLIALVIILAVVPWPSRPGIGRPLLPFTVSPVLSARNP